jgi:hypothetical protein
MLRRPFPIAPEGVENDLLEMAVCSYLAPSRRPGSVSHARNRGQPDQLPETDA